MWSHGVVATLHSDEKRQDSFFCCCCFCFCYRYRRGEATPIVRVRYKCFCAKSKSLEGSQWATRMHDLSNWIFAHTYNGWDIFGLCFRHGTCAQTPFRLSSPVMRSDSSRLPGIPKLSCRFLVKALLPALKRLATPMVPLEPHLRRNSEHRSMPKITGPLGKRLPVVFSSS